MNIFSQLHTQWIAFFQFYTHWISFLSYTPSEYFFSIIHPLNLINIFSQLYNQNYKSLLFFFFLNKWKGIGGRSAMSRALHDLAVLTQTVLCSVPLPVDWAGLFCFPDDTLDIPIPLDSNRKSSLFLLFGSVDFFCFSLSFPILCTLVICTRLPTRSRKQALAYIIFCKV